ncbi:MAG: hypothetical protein AKCLJLPJ_01050 [Fimbriimonadales bacterium]|nr:hypothetical protein [Fimbriimonadales bacterium]
MEESRPKDRFGLILGAIVFLGGISLLGLTFYKAWDLFSQPPSTLIESSNPDVAKIGASIGDVFLRIAFLLVMCVAGSIISSRGIQMYFAASGQTSTKQKKLP